MLLLMLGLLTTSGGALDDFRSPKAQCEIMRHARTGSCVLQTYWHVVLNSIGQHMQCAALLCGESLTAVSYVTRDETGDYSTDGRKDDTLSDS